MKKKLLIFLLLSLTVILAACGGNDEASEPKDESASNSNSEIEVTATNFEFNQPEYTVQSGDEVKINLSNADGSHGIAIDEFDVDIQGDGEATFTPDKPGEYTIYCNIPCGQGHDDMQSKLIVE
ncbi:MAG TPA: cupredoxin domain-containing protein [Pseudogracilibacillus sp.]|nr:cupredoxin domain-containing protein [Pseudogracilibacillus sp.]